MKPHIKKTPYGWIVESPWNCKDETTLLQALQFTVSLNQKIGFLSTIPHSNRFLTNYCQIRKDRLK